MKLTTNSGTNTVICCGAFRHPDLTQGSNKFGDQKIHSTAKPSQSITGNSRRSFPKILATRNSMRTSTPLDLSNFSVAVCRATHVIPSRQRRWFAVISPSAGIGRPDLLRGGKNRKKHARLNIRNVFAGCDEDKRSFCALKR